MLVQEGAFTKDGERWIVGAGWASLEMPPTAPSPFAGACLLLR